jgi:O-antigen ligase
MTAALAILFAPPFLLAAGFGAWRLYRSFAFGASLLVLTYVLGAITIAPLGLQLAGLHLYLEDLTALGLACAAAVRFALAPRLRRLAKSWNGFAAAAALAFVLGAASHGLKAAGVEFRGFFYLCSAVLYFASFPLCSRRLKSLATVWLAGAAVLLALAIFRWSAGLLHPGLASHWAEVGGGHRMRVLNASQTFFLAQALLIALYFRRRSAPRGAWTSLSVLIAMLAAAVILLQHRSVWVSLLLAIAAICWREGVFRRLVSAGALAAVLGSSLYFAAPAVFSRENSVADSLATSVEEPFNPDHGTLGWRVEMWQAYLLEFLNASNFEKLTGKGFGNPASYAVDTIETVDSAHNYYVFTLNRTGILGLAGLLAAQAAMLRMLRRNNAAPRWNHTGLLFGIVVSQLVYYTVYSPSPDQGFLAGAVLGAGAFAAKAREEVHREATAAA